jgi:hypothetical protein
LTIKRLCFILSRIYLGARSRLSINALLPDLNSPTLISASSVRVVSRYEGRMYAGGSMEGHRCMLPLLTLLAAPILSGAPILLVNWDAGGSATPATIFPAPMTTFSNRGNVFTTPGTGFEISGQSSPEFGAINATYPDIFTSFSSPRLFDVAGSNVIDVHLTVPGTANVPAPARGFGEVFTDLDLAGLTTLELYGAGEASIETHAATPLDDGLSFLGFALDEAILRRARIPGENSALSANDGGGVDAAAVDAFVSAEPDRIPEPTALVLMGAAVVAIVLARFRRRTNGQATGR